MVNAVALAVMAPSVLSYVGDHVGVLADSRPCPRGAATARPADTHVLVTMAWSCPAGDGDLHYRVTLFQDVDPAARHVAVIVTERGEREFVLDRTAPEIDLSGAGSSTLQVVGRFIRAGIEHIFLGYDHIAFLLAVILWGRSLWPLVKVVTAFTLAHSLTLCLAVLDIVRLPSSVVEPLIAATIVFVAAENFFVHDIRKRWRATFVLGLVHGFGFAGALREYGLPTRRGSAGAGGVQHRRRDRASGDRGPHLPVAIVVRSARRRGGDARAAAPGGGYTCSAVILACGIYWLMERTVFA